MCADLFIDKNCCRSCLFKYIPFGAAKKRHEYSVEEAKAHHALVDAMYAQPDPLVKPLIDRIKVHIEKDC